MKKIYTIFCLLLLFKLQCYAQGTVPAPAGYTFGVVNGIVTDTNYDVWTAFGKFGLGKFDRFLWTMYDTANSPLPSNNILSVAYNNSGVWAGTDSGLYNLNGVNWQWYNTSNSNIPGDTIPQLYSSGGADLFIISYPGFIYFNGTGFQRYSTSNSGLICDTVQCIFKSHAGLWWIGTNHGLSSFDGTTWQNYTVSNSDLCGDNIESLNEDKNNYLFVGTYNNGLSIKSGSVFTNLANYLNPYFSIPQSVDNEFRLSNGSILAANAYTGSAYIISTNPVAVIDKSFTSFSLTASNYIYAIDKTNRIYKEQKSHFFMTYTDSVNVPLYTDSVNLNSNVTVPSGFNYLDVNEVKCGMWNNNTYFWNTVDNVPGYEVPKECGQTAVFASALWIGGLDAGGNLHLAAQTYRQSGSDFWDGPLDTVDASLDANTKARYDSVWKIDKDTINQFVIQYNLGNVTNHSYQVPAEILNWPAQGSGNYSKNLAPFVDHNGDGIYNPYDGDYPEMKGDQMLWWVMNDNYNAHGETGGTPLGIEVRSEAYAHACQSVADSDDAINYTTFYSDSIINRSNSDYHNVYIGIWEDPDLGYAYDDFVGCRIDGNYAFDYNGENDDPVYGNNPPVISTVVFNDTLTHFMYYNNDFSVRGNPLTANNYYNYLQSIWIDSTHLSYGGNGYGGDTLCNYFFSGIPYDTGWTELSAGDVPGDRRFLMAIGPVTLPAHQSKKMDYAIVFSWDKAAPNGDTTSIAKNDRDVRAITHLFETLNYPCNYALSVPEVKKDELGFTIYPNPATSQLTISLSTFKQNGETRITIINALGQLLYQSAITNLQSEIDISNLPAGVYFLQLKSESGSPNGRNRPSAVSAAKMFVKE